MTAIQYIPTNYSEIKRTNSTIPYLTNIGNSIFVPNEELVSKDKFVLLFPEIVLIGGETFIIPQKLKTLQKTIEKSTYIFGLQDNWDDEGSLGYDKTTWAKAVRFVIDYAKWILNNFDKVMYIPEIYHGRDSGIDILWENKEFCMLIRFDKQIENSCFYSNNLHQQTSEGEFQVSKINYLMLPTPIAF